MSCPKRLAQAALGAWVVLGAVAPAVAAVVYSLQSELSVSETYTDNVKRLDERRSDDYVTKVDAFVTLEGRTPRLTTSASYRFNTEYFAKETETQGPITHRGWLFAGYRATERFTVRLGGYARVGFSTGRDPSPLVLVPAGAGAAPPAVDPEGIPTRRIREFQTIETIGWDYRLDAFTRVSGEYRFNTLEYDTPDLTDIVTHSASLAGTRQVGRNDSIGLAYVGSLSRFGEDGSEERQSHDVRLSWAHDFSAGITASAGVGAAWTDASGVKAGVVGDASLRKQAGRTLYTLGYNGSYTTGAGESGLLRADRVTAAVARDLSARVRGELGAGYTRSEPLEGPSAPTHYYSATARVTAQVTRSLRAALTCAYDQVEGPADQDTFRNTQVTVGLTYVLPQVVINPF